MKLNEAEMRMAYQIESTDPNAVLNEIYMTWRLSRNQATAGYPRMINRRAIATVLSIRKKSSKSMRWTEDTRISSSILMMASQGRRLTGPVSRA